MANNNLTKQPKVIFCDVDNTLTSGNTWFALTTALNGDIEKHYQLFASYLKGNLGFDQMKLGLFSMWEQGFGKKITRQDPIDILFKVQLKGEVFSTFSELRVRGYQLCLISSSMDLFVGMVAQRLQVDHWFANAQLIFDAKDNWIDFKYDKNEAELKLKQVQTFLKENKINQDECLVLGEGHEEEELFKHYAGIAIDSENEALKKLAWHEIKYLPTILQILQEIGS